MTDEFPEKAGQKHGVNKLRDTGTVDVATKRNRTTTGFPDHSHFTKENNYAVECLIF